MTRLVLDIGELPDTLAMLREAAEAAARDSRDAAAARVFILADAIEAVADKPEPIVFEPDPDDAKKAVESLRYHAEVSARSPFETELFEELLDHLTQAFMTPGALRVIDAAAKHGIDVHPERAKAIAAELGVTS